MASIESIKNEPNRSVSRPEQHEPRYHAPPTDILESPTDYLLLADMPGVQPGDVSIQVDANQLKIEGRYENLDGAPAAFRRVFQVGPGVDPNGITAELKHGVLHLVARKSEALKPRQIAVRAG